MENIALQEQEAEDIRNLREMEQVVAQVVEDVLDKIYEPEIEVCIEALPEYDSEEEIAVHDFFREGDEMNGVAPTPVFRARCACGWPGDEEEFAISSADNIMDAYETARMRHGKENPTCKLTVRCSSLG